MGKDSGLMRDRRERRSQGLMRGRWAGRRGGARRAGQLLVASAASMAVLVSGCATIPSSGMVQSTPPALGGGGSACCGLIIQGPQRGWTPEQVVRGFLLAGAVFAHHHAIARRYLTPAASRSWQPRSAVTILAGTPEASQQPGRLAEQGGRTIVVVKGRKVATLNSSGQYIPARGGAAAQQWGFSLQSVHGQTLIDGLPGTGPGHVSHELLLTSAFFHLVYTPRDLYYVLADGSLVPDPVFVPSESPNRVETLISDLLHDPKGWLSGAATSAFPAGARLKTVQTLPGAPGEKSVTVDISLPAATPSARVKSMAAQLVTTLTSPAYSQPLFDSVRLKFNGRLWDSPGGPLQRMSDYAKYIPHLSGGAEFYYLTRGGAVRTLSRLSARGEPVRGQAGTGEVPLNEVAVSPDGRYLAGIAGPASTLYTASLGSGQKSRAGPSDGKLQVRLTGSAFAGLSWDSADRLWLAGSVGRSRGVWVLPAAQGAPERVRLPAHIGTVTRLQLAPDGVRIAMIVGKGASAHLVLGAVASDGARFAITRPVPLGSGLSTVSALTWYDADHLLAVTQSDSVTRLWEVPVDGDVATYRGATAGMVSVTAAGPGNPLYLSMNTGRLLKSVGFNEPWTEMTYGRAPTYRG